MTASMLDGARRQRWPPAIPQGHEAPLRLAGVVHTMWARVGGSRQVRRGSVTSWSWSTRCRASWSTGRGVLVCLGSLSAGVGGAVSPAPAREARLESVEKVLTARHDHALSCLAICLRCASARHDRRQPTVRAWARQNNVACSTATGSPTASPAAVTYAATMSLLDRLL